MSGVLRNGQSDIETRSLCYSMQNDCGRVKRIDDLPLGNVFFDCPGSVIS